MYKERLSWDECKPLWAGSVINSSKVPIDDKMCLWWTIWWETLWLLWGFFGRGLNDNVSFTT